MMEFDCAEALVSPIEWTSNRADQDNAPSCSDLAATDFVLISSASGLISSGRHAATFLPYGREDHDLGINWADTVNPLSRAWRGAASFSVPNATWYPPFLRVPPPAQPPLGPREEYGASGDWRVAPLARSRFLPLPPAPDRPAYIQGLLDGQFGSYGIMAPPGDPRQAADSSLPPRRSAAVDVPTPADFGSSMEGAAASSPTRTTSSSDSMAVFRQASAVARAATRSQREALTQPHLVLVDTLTETSRLLPRATVGATLDRAPRAQSTGMLTSRDRENVARDVRDEARTQGQLRAGQGPRPNQPAPRTPPPGRRDQDGANR